MRVRDAEINYQSATHAIFAACRAKNRNGAINLQKICTLHKVNSNYGTMLVDRGFVIRQQKGKAFWNPERDIPTEAAIEEMRLALLGKPAPEAKAKPRMRVVGGTALVAAPVQQEPLPLSADHRESLTESLMVLHMAIGAVLRELGVKV